MQKRTIGCFERQCSGSNPTISAPPHFLILHCSISRYPETAGGLCIFDWQIFSRFPSMTEAVKCSVRFVLKAIIFCKNDDDDDDDDDDHHHHHHNHENHNNHSNNGTERRNSRILFYNLLSELSLTCALKWPRPKSCENHAQHIGRSSRETCPAPHGTKGQLSF